MPQIPAGRDEFRCMGCRYDLSGKGVEICPECGRPSGDADRDRWRQRGVWLAAFDAPRFVLIWILILAVYGAGGAVFMLASGSASVVPALVGPVAGITVSVTAGVAIGLALGATSGEHDRRAAALAWLRTVWLLHLPWLVIPLCAGIALAVAARELTRGGDAWIVEQVAGAGLLALLFGSVAAGVVWLSVFASAASRACVRWSSLQFFLIGMGAATLALINLVLGITGGFASMEGAIGLVGLDRGWEDF
jgi:hypothetical protein